MPRILVIALFLSLSLPAAAAEMVAGLTEGQAIVTGREADAERTRGLRAALIEALVKLSGDASLAHDPMLAPLLDRAEEMVADIRYEDRLAKKTLMDEQGTRQRSHLMTVTFRREALDQALRQLGREPWAAVRPRLLVLLGVQEPRGAFALAVEGRGQGQREALLDTAARRGVPLVLPRMDVADQAALMAGGGIATLKQRYEAEAVLMGTMSLRQDGTWDTGWTLLHDGAPETWSVDGGTVDRAIREGIAHAAKVLAGVK